MKLIPISEFRRLAGKEGLQAVSPCAITVDGDVVGYFGSADDFLFVADLHIRVRNQFRALEKKVRMGMPKPERADVAEFIYDPKKE